MRGSVVRLSWNVFKIGKEGVPLTQKQQILKEDLEKRYFKDMHDLTVDPSGKLFPAQSLVGSEKLDMMPFFNLALATSDGKSKTLTLQEAQEKGRMVFIVFQMGFYASAYACEWKHLILSRWPHLQDRMFAVEICERNAAYSLLRWVTQRQVQQKWCEPLPQMKPMEASSLLSWQETGQNTVQTRAMRKVLGVEVNKYIPFVYVVQKQGLIVYKAVGKPVASELDIMEEALTSKKV